MQWLDVCGAPGAGKSTLCDPIYGPHDIEFGDAKPPAEWHDFLNEVTRLLGLVREHQSFVPAVRMNRRSVRKMAAVACQESGLYIQTGFIQRGLGFGWRLTDMGVDLAELRHFFRLMPVSLGACFCEADTALLEQRNKDRESVKETAHENRSFMVELMAPAIALAKECLDERDVPYITIKTGSSTEDECRAELISFASERSFITPTPGHPCEVSVLSPPVWW